MKKLLLISLVSVGVAVLILVSAVFVVRLDQPVVDNELFSVAEQPDGAFVLRFKEYVPKEDTGIFAYSYVNYPHFSTTEEMLRRIRTGDFVEAELKDLKDLANEDGEIPMFDIHNVYTVTLPSSMRINYISWSGSDYYYEIIGDLNEDSGKNSLRGFTAKLSEDDFERMMKRDWEHEGRSLRRIETSADGFYTVRAFWGNASAVNYTWVINEKIYYVAEMYEHGMDLGTFEDTLRGDTTDPKIPTGICIYTNENGEYSQTFLIDPEYRPSVEWLSSFGLIPYVEDASAEVS